MSTEALMISAKGGGIIPGNGTPAYRSWFSDRPPLPVIISVPHAGRNYPAEVLKSLRTPEQTQLRLEDRYVDLVALEAARLTGAGLIVADAPRAMIDLNRAPDDIDWSMIRQNGSKPVNRKSANSRSRIGLGLFPRRVSSLGELWRTPLDRQAADERIAGIHQPYHADVRRELERLRDYWGAALLVDLHSMPPLLSNGSNRGQPSFVIGDRFGTSCDSSLIHTAITSLETSGRRVAHNRPYAGGYVLDTHGQAGRGIHAMQIEICRSIYLDGRLEWPSPRLAGVGRVIAGLVRHLSAQVSHLAARSIPPLAAE